MNNPWPLHQLIINCSFISFSHHKFTTENQKDFHTTEVQKAMLEFSRIFTHFPTCHFSELELKALTHPRSRIVSQLVSFRCWLFMLWLLLRCRPFLMRVKLPFNLMRLMQWRSLNSRFLPANVDLDYVEGDFPTSNLRPAANPAANGFSDDTSDILQHHFGGFFDGNFFNPFNSFGGIGFGSSFNGYKPWYKG